MSGVGGMSLSDDVPVPVRRFVDSTNADDADAVVALFTPDAHLVDGARSFDGREGVADWDRTDNTGKRSRFELLGAKPGETEVDVVATVVVSGEGFNGTSDLAFTLRGDEIARLVVGA